MGTSRTAYDHLFKLLIIGDSDHYVTTVGVDFKVRTISIDGERVKLQIWDTAGQERFRTITSTYYRGTHGVIVVFDLTVEETFVNVKRWLSEIDQNCDVVQRVLVGNKCDDADNRKILELDARQYAARMNVPYFEASAKDNINVEQIFTSITRLVLDQKKSYAAQVNQPNSQRFGHENKPIKLKSSRKRRKKKGCC